MVDTDFVPEPDERVFPLPRSAATSAALWLLGGLGGFGLAAVGFVLAQVWRVDELSMHAMTTLPALIGVGAVLASWMMARTPRAVGISPSGVRIVGRHDSRTHPWDQIGWSTIQLTPLTHRRHLRLYDADGRMIAKLSDTIEDFDALAELIAALIAAKGDETADRIQLAKAKRMAIFMAVAGLAFLALAGMVAYITYHDLRAARLLQTSAVAGEAEIEERFLAPNGITPRLVYRITTPDGRSETRNAEVIRPVWDRLEGVKTVPVIYVPDEPWISRLAFGEAEDRNMSKQPWIGYGLPAAVAVMSIFFLIASALMWRGWDIDLDSKTGRISIKRFGSGR